MIEVISDKDVEIRKSHRCIVYNRKFDPPTLMHCQVNIYDVIQSIYSCMTCQSLIKDEFLLLNDENGYDAECLQESMYQDNFKGTPEEYLQFKQKKGEKKR